MEIKVSTVVAMETLAKNRASHIKEYAKQLAGWEVKMKEYGEYLGEWAIKAEDRRSRRPEPKKPKDYTSEYDILISMLDHHIQGSIILDENDFRKVIGNEFGWSEHFAFNSATYID